MFHRRMTFGGNSTSGVGRSTSCPRPNRSASSPRRRLGAGSRDDDDDGGGGGGGGGGDDDDDDGGESAEDLRQTISNLRHSIMAHAESSAESGERLSSLRAAHDSLLAEHLRLQEQMDDAVELLKYLKEEKGGYEERVSELSAEVESLRDAAEGDVVSMTISNLTREKMALESQLAEERRGGLARAAVAACAGMDDGGGRGGSTTSTSTFANREVVGRLERKNAELADEVESLRKAQSESTKRIEDMKRTNRVVEEAQKEKERARRMAKEEEDDDRAARYEGERIELLRRVEELGRELGSARAREIEERESRRLRDAASASGGIEGELSAAERALRRDLEACDRARRIAEAERDALLEERDGAASDRDGAIDNLRLANMQLESEREESDEMRRSIEAERDALLEEKEAMLARHRDEISATRARLEEVTKTTTTTTTNTRVGGEGGDSLSNGGDGDDATYEGGDDDDDDGIDSQMDRMNEKFENLERINRELVQEGRDMKLYVATMAETLTRKDEDHETAEMQFQIERGELRIQVSSLRSEVEDYRRRLSTMKEGATTRKKDEEDLIHGERREMQQQLASLHGRVESYQRQYASLQERVHEYQRREEEYQRRDEILREEIEGCERARSEAEDKVRELRDQLENHSSTSSLQYPDNLEKEMQDRLSKR